MKNAFGILSLLVLTNAALAAEFTAKKVYLDLRSLDAVQAIVGYEAASGDLVLVDGEERCIRLPYRTGLCPVTQHRIPIKVVGYQIGLGLGLSQQYNDRDPVREIELKNYEGKTIQSLFGNYYGVNALQLDLLFVGFRGVTAAAMNTSRVVAYRLLSGYAGNGGGVKANLVSLGRFSIRPDQEHRKFPEAFDVVANLILKNK
jgi:hypothetical protein